MSRKFDQLVSEALEVERDLRRLRLGRPSLRCWIHESLARAGATYAEVEAVKERLAVPVFERQSGTGAYTRHLTREIAAGRFKEPPEKGRIASLYWNQKDQAVLELGGKAFKLFLLWVIAVEQTYQQKPDVDVFGSVEDLAAHKARIAELQTS